MGVSLAFGVVFATSITLLLVPAYYLILEDGLRMLRGERGQPAAMPGPISTPI